MSSKKPESTLEGPPTVKGIDLDQIVGRTVQAVRHRSLPQQYGSNPVIDIYFTDNTYHSFVLPSSDEEED